MHLPWRCLVRTRCIITLVTVLPEHILVRHKSIVIPRFWWRPFIARHIIRLVFRQQRIDTKWILRWWTGRILIHGTSTGTTSVTIDKIRLIVSIQLIIVCHIATVIERRWHCVFLCGSWWCRMRWIAGGGIFKCRRLMCHRRSRRWGGTYRLSWWLIVQLRQSRTVAVLKRMNGRWHEFGYRLCHTIVKH